MIKRISLLLAMPLENQINHMTTPIAPSTAVCYKPLVAVVGPSGSGKSTSLENLPPENTYILDYELKGFPFKTKKFGDHIIPVENAAQQAPALARAKADPKCKIIVHESGIKYFEHIKIVANGFKGYDIYSYYNREVGKFLNSLKSPTITTIVTFIDEIVSIPLVTGGASAQRRIAVQGKEWEGKVEKEFLMVLFTEPRKGKDGGIEYKFQTNTDGTTSAKTPRGMFSEMYIPNDIMTVINTAEKYLNE